MNSLLIDHYKEKQSSNFIFLFFMFNENNFIVFVYQQVKKKRESICKFINE